MKNPKYKTLRLPVKHRFLVSRFPSAGPHPNVWGMKNKFYGMDSLCVMCGSYVYHVDAPTYEKCEAIIRGRVSTV